MWRFKFCSTIYKRFRLNLTISLYQGLSLHPMDLIDGIHQKTEYMKVIKEGDFFDTIFLPMRYKFLV